MDRWWKQHYDECMGCSDSGIPLALDNFGDLGMPSARLLKNELIRQCPECEPEVHRIGGYNIYPVAWEDCMRISNMEFDDAVRKVLVAEGLIEEDGVNKIAREAAEGFVIEWYWGKHTQGKDDLVALAQSFIVDAIERTCNCAGGC